MPSSDAQYLWLLKEKEKEGLSGIEERRRSSHQKEGKDLAEERKELAEERKKLDKERKQLAKTTKVVKERSKRRTYTLVEDTWGEEEHPPGARTHLFGESGGGGGPSKSTESGFGLVVGGGRVQLGLGLELSLVAVDKIIVDRALLLPRRNFPVDIPSRAPCRARCPS